VLLGAVRGGQKKLLYASGHAWFKGVPSLGELMGMKMRRRVVWKSLKKIGTFQPLPCMSWELYSASVQR
jgi:hypothetical protein